jgi:hypothetical protein
MKQKQHTTGQVIHKLREADAVLGSGATVADVCLRPQGVGRLGSAKGRTIASVPSTVG